MSDKEMREAVGFFNSWGEDEARALDDIKEHEAVLVNFAESYLFHSGECPEVKDERNSNYSVKEIRAYNEALQDCKLAMMKRCSVERIKEAIIKSGKVELDELAQTIHSVIMGEIEREK